MRPFLFLFLILAWPFNLSAQNQLSGDTLPKAFFRSGDSMYTKPVAFDFIKHVPADLLAIGKSPFQRKNLPAFLAITGSTLLLLPFDQALLNGVKDISDQIGLNPKTSYQDIWRPFGTRVIKFPRNINTALYQLGEGGTSMLVAAGFFVYGKFRHDNRSLHTASDLAETFLTMGISTQVLKRISGRQSPFMAIHPGGDWHPFPSFKDYQQNTSNFDAFPSGHLATMMATVTVIATNYPEKKWIRPLGYSLIGLSAWAMMNNEVHWISDYPLALALGYISGKITCMRHQKRNSRIKPIL